MNDELNSGFDIVVTRSPINYVGDELIAPEQKKERIKFLRKQRKAERDASKVKTTVKRVKV
jgi:hypothetical protein